MMAAGFADNGQITRQRTRRLRNECTFPNLFFLVSMAQINCPVSGTLKYG